MSINEVAVFASALFTLAVGSIWYSPIVFGKHWQRAAGLTDADLELPKSLFLRSLTIAFLSNLLVQIVIGYSVRFSEIYNIPSASIAGGMILLLFASVAGMVVWEKRSLIYFGIHIGYVILTVIFGFFIIKYWPW